LPTNSQANTLAAEQQTFTVSLNSQFVTLTSKRRNVQPDIQIFLCHGVKLLVLTWYFAEFLAVGTPQYEQIQYQRSMQNKMN